MLKQISLLLIICLSSLCVFTQTEKYSAPVKWERYKVGDKGISVLLPKLPVLNQGIDVCSETEMNRYAVYADQTVYGLTIVSKTKEKAPAFCTNKRKFDEKSFDERLREIKTKLKTFDETKFSQNNFEVLKIKSVDKTFTHWLFTDFRNKRWFELWTTDDEKIEAKNFIESIKIEKNVEGIEIGNGASRTLGDEGVAVENTDSQNKKIENNPIKAETENIRIIVKPYARYTDAARQAQIQGTVTLKVTFLANGGIGSVTPVNDLPYGLTEQAIFAASRIVFIPAKKNGTTYTVIKTVQYSFSIY
ncbi:MAG: energy transducer TonB [Acidobacteria bacterium]|nr:energy transducer TonB [Acidobacteriota bacterium]MCA1639828.1 energy transducer TonB [Acidobacteriota bacterium]